MIIIILKDHCTYYLSLHGCINSIQVYYYDSVTSYELRIHLTQNNINDESSALVG